MCHSVGTAKREQVNSTEGRGAADLAKIGCKNKPTPENKACHAPNRRVVISITGTRK